jgi:hypothetical protein
MTCISAPLLLSPLMLQRKGEQLRGQKPARTERTENLLRMSRLTADFLTAASFCSMSFRKSPLSSLSAALLSLGMRIVH